MVAMNGPGALQVRSEPPNLRSPHGNTPPASGGARFRPAQEIGADHLRGQAQALLDDGFRLTLVAAHRPTPHEGHRVVYLFTAPRPDRRIELVVRTVAGSDTVPSLALLTFPAGRFERELYETSDILASSASPYRGIEAGAARASALRADPVRPRWEAQAEGRRLRSLFPRIERAVPDSGVSHAVSLCLAIEDAYDRPVPEPVAAARAVLIELERTLSHLDSISVMCAGARLPQQAVEAIALRRRILQLNDEICGHRLLRGAVVPGGVRLRGLPSDAQLCALEAATAELAGPVLASPVLRQTYRGRWLLTNRHAAMTGALGCIARASGIDIDARRDHPFHPATTGVESVTSHRGDAFARLEVRVGELGTGLRLLRDLLPHARPAAAKAPADPLFEEARDPLRGIGLVESPHGTIAHRLEVAPGGRVAHLRVVDPSFLSRSVLTVSQRGPHDENGSTVESGFELPPRELMR
jgi:Ni,Fe-hydrogenase III large subunit